MTERVHLTGLTQVELTTLSEEMGQPGYRGRQIFSSLQHRRLRSFDEMTDLPKDFRSALENRANAATLTVESRYLSADGTRRYLMKTHDNLPVVTRSVFLPNPAARCSALFV
jgi:23S rRNA (adenine2503-C2)-methyltransferase